MGVVRMLTCWDQVEKIFWFTTCFNFKKGAELPEPSSEFGSTKKFGLVSESLEQTWQNFHNILEIWELVSDLLLKRKIMQLSKTG